MFLFCLILIQMTRMNALIPSIFVLSFSFLLLIHVTSKLRVFPAVFLMSLRNNSFTSLNQEISNVAV